MKTSFISLIVLALIAPSFAAEDKPELESIFNGKDLTGWKAPDPNPFWTVKDGVLVGANDEKLKASMLYSEKSYGDCIVEAECRFTGEIDSGIMLRKPEIQVQIGVSRSLKKDMTCSVYAKGKYPGQAKDVDKHFKKDDWNTIRIMARGEKYTVWLNGQEVLQYEDKSFPNPGPIGLQIHGGLKMQVEFRNIKAKAL